MTLPFNWPGVNQASPDQPMAVRMSGGENFIDAPFMVRVAAGDLPDWRTVHRFGRNVDVGATVEDLWPPGGVQVLPTIEATLSIVSDDANDDVGGSGAEQIEIHGLDLSLNEISEILNLNGTTPVTSINSYFRINHVDVEAAGASGFNEGNISLSHSGNILSYISAEEGHSRLTHYTVPGGMTAWVLNVQSWQGKDETTDTAMWHRHNDTGVWHLDFSALNYRIQTSVQAEYMAKYNGVGYEGGVDIKMTAKKTGGGANVDVTGRYVLLVKER